MLKNIATFLLVVLIWSNVNAQDKDIGIKDAIHYLAYTPTVAANLLIKAGFEKVGCVGHPWKDSQAGDICMMNNNQQVIAISPGKSGDGSEILIMFIGSEKNIRFDKELIKENFTDLRLYEKGANEIWSSDTWAQIDNSDSKTIFFNRKKTLKELPEKTTYFIYIYSQSSTERPHNKLEPEVGKTLPKNGDASTHVNSIEENIQIDSKTLLGMNYYWKEANIHLSFPENTILDTVNEFRRGYHIRWPGGEWSENALNIFIGRNDGISPEQFVKSRLMIFVPNDRKDSVIHHKDKRSGASLYMVESRGKSGERNFLAINFQFITPSRRLVNGSYTSYKPAEAENTLQTIKDILLNAYTRTLSN